MSKKIINKNSGDVNLQAQLSELDNLLAWFEQDEFDLEEAMAKYETAMKLVEIIEKRLKTAENNIQVLQKRFDGA